MIAMLDKIMFDSPKAGLYACSEIHGAWGCESKWRTKVLSWLGIWLTAL